MALSSRLCLLYMMVLCLIVSTIALDISNINNVNTKSSLKLKGIRSSLKDTYLVTSGVLQLSNDDIQYISKNNMIRLTLDDDYVFPFYSHYVFTLYDSRTGYVVADNTVELPPNTKSIGDQLLTFYQDSIDKTLNTYRLQITINFYGKTVPQSMDINKVLTSIKYTYIMDNKSSLDSIIPLYVGYPLSYGDDTYLTIDTPCYHDLYEGCKIRPYSITLRENIFNMTDIRYAIAGQSYIDGINHDDDTKTYDCYINNQHVKGQYVVDKDTSIEYISFKHQFRTGYDYTFSCPQLTIKSTETKTAAYSYLEMIGYDRENPQGETFSVGHAYVYSVQDTYQPIISSYTVPITPNEGRWYHYSTFNISNNDSPFHVQPASIYANFTVIGIDTTYIDVFVYPKVTGTVHPLVDPIIVKTKYAPTKIGLYPDIDLTEYIQKYKDISIHIRTYSSYPANSDKMIQYGLSVGYVSTPTSQYVIKRYSRIDSLVTPSLSQKPYNAVAPSDELKLDLVAYPSAFRLKNVSIVLDMSSQSIQFDADDGIMVTCSLYRFGEEVILSPSQRLTYDQYGKQLPLKWDNIDDYVLGSEFKCDIPLVWAYGQPAQITASISGQEQETDEYQQHILDMTYIVKG